jgi:hypothetical protein
VQPAAANGDCRQTVDIPQASADKIQRIYWLCLFAIADFDKDMSARIVELRK